MLCRIAPDGRPREKIHQQPAPRLLSLIAIGVARVAPNIQTALDRHADHIAEPSGGRHRVKDPVD